MTFGWPSSIRGAGWPVPAMQKIEAAEAVPDQTAEEQRVIAQAKTRIIGAGRPATNYSNAGAENSGSSP